MQDIKVTEELDEDIFSNPMICKECKDLIEMFGLERAAVEFWAAQKKHTTKSEKCSEKIAARASKLRDSKRDRIEKREGECENQKPQDYIERAKRLKESAYWKRELSRTDTTGQCSKGSCSTSTTS